MSFVLVISRHFLSMNCSVSMVFPKRIYTLRGQQNKRPWHPCRKFRRSTFEIIPVSGFFRRRFLLPDGFLTAVMIEVTFSYLIVNVSLSFAKACLLIPRANFCAGKKCLKRHCFCKKSCIKFKHDKGP